MEGKVPQSVVMETKRNWGHHARLPDHRATHQITDECGGLWGPWRATGWVAFIIVICTVFAESAPVAAEQKAKSQNKPERKEDSLNEELIRLVESHIVRFTNKYRKKARLQPLKINPALTFLARKQNDHMCANGTLSHESKLFPKGWRRFSDRMQAVRVRSAGENIAYSSIGEDPKQWAEFIVEGWMKSPGHRKNILNAKFNYLGVAVRECGGRIAYATQVFSSDIGRIPWRR
jgi:uncharacterized protein YkwD